MYEESLSDPKGGAFVVIPSDSQNLTGGYGGATSLYIGVSGDVKVTTMAGDTVTFKNLSNGSILPIRVEKVFASGTSATYIIGLY